MRKLPRDRDARKAEGEEREGLLSDVQATVAAPGANDVPRGPERTSADVLIILPHCRPKNPLNNAQGLTRGATFAKARARKALRELAGWSTRASLPAIRRLGVPIEVELLRIAPRPYDSDGWAAAAKPLRDGFADALGVRDNDPMITWRYSQERGHVREYAVRIIVRRA